MPVVRQVVNEAGVGVKLLLEIAMRCSLQCVDVYELRELTLDSWRDLEAFMEPVHASRNRELLNLIETLPVTRQVLGQGGAGATGKAAPTPKNVINRAFPGLRAFLANFVWGQIKELVRAHPMVHVSAHFDVP